MSLTDQVLSALLLYGLPVLFSVVLVCSVGVPFPVSLLLIASGSFVQQGEMKLWQVVAVGSLAAILGDHLGYGLARWGGRHLVARISVRLGIDLKIQRAEALTRRWSGAGIFLSRWLVTALGPWVNVTSGITGYPWQRFLVWDVLGEVIWVAMYVTLGYIFSDRVQALVEILGSLAWVIVGLILATILGWKVLGYFRTAKEQSS